MDTKKLSEVALIFIGLITLVFILREFQSFLKPLTLSFVLSFFFTPLFRLSNKNKYKHILKIVFSLGIFLLLLVVGGYYLVNAVSEFNKDNVISSETHFLDSVCITIRGTKISLSDYLDPGNIQASLSNLIKQLVQSISGFVSDLFLIVLFLIFILPAQNIYFKTAAKKMSIEKRKLFLDSVFDLENGVREYLNAKTIISFGTAITSFIIMIIFGVKYTLLFSLLIFLLNFIPNIGSIMAVGLILIIEFFSNGFGPKLIALTSILVLIQILFGNIVDPKLTGKRLRLSPLTVLLSLFFWGAIWGVSGMLFSVPLTLVVKKMLEHSTCTKELADWIA